MRSNGEPTTATRSSVGRERHELHQTRASQTDRRMPMRPAGRNARKPAIARIDSAEPGNNQTDCVTDLVRDLEGRGRFAKARRVLQQQLRQRLHLDLCAWTDRNGMRIQPLVAVKQDQSGRFSAAPSHEGLNLSRGRCRGYTILMSSSLKSATALRTAPAHTRIIQSTAAM